MIWDLLCAMLVALMPSVTTAHLTGVFDSGVGGLTVLRKIHALLPHEELLYVADTAWCPYGTRSAEEIINRANIITHHLVEAGARAIVVACNTATIAAVETLRNTYPVPFVGMEPAVKPAAEATRTGIIGVLATDAALSGEKFHRLAARHAPDIRILTQACPGLVERVEAGSTNAPETRALLRRYLHPLLDQGADTLILGCTHYPFLRPLVEDLVGPDVTVLDTGTAVARQLARVLSPPPVASADGRKGQKIQILTTGDPRSLGRILHSLCPELPDPTPLLL